MPGGAGQLSRGGGGQGRGAVTAEPSWAAERPSRRDPGEVGPPSGCRRSRGCPDAGQAGRCPVRLVRSRRGDVRPTGRADIQRPRVRCPRVRCPVPSRCPDGPGSGVRGAAAALSAARWPLEWLGVAGRSGRAQRVDVPVVRGRRGRLPASGRTARGWCGVGRGWLARGSTLGQGRRLAGVPAAAPPGRRADTGAGPGQGAGRVAGEHGAEQVLTGPAGRPGQVAGVVPDHGPGSRGGDHAGWSLGWWWSRGVQLRRARSVRWGSSLRPQRGRGA
jgi:hypothetical protein